jgi:hypothetical protein
MTYWSFTAELTTNYLAYGSHMDSNPKLGEMQAETPRYFSDITMHSLFHLSKRIYLYFWGIIFSLFLY